VAQGILYNEEDNDVGGNTTVSATSWYSNKEDKEDRTTSAGQSSVSMQWISSFVAWSWLVVATLYM